MRLTTLFLASLLPLFAQSSAEADAIAVVQRFFDALAAHDGQAIRSLMLPDARISTARGAADPASTTAADLAARIAADKTALLERFTTRPNVLTRGRIAQVWGEYAFHRDGKFSHCGVDSVTLFLTSGGWRIASLAYTVETAGCPGHP
jgi:ketosteroid isomerase-like protein